MTRTRSILLAVTLATAALAGCIGADGSEDDAGPEDLDETSVNDTDENATDAVDEPEPVFERYWHNGTIEGGSVPEVGWYCTPGAACENTLEFQVPDGAEAVHVEATWEEDASVWFNVSGPACETTLLGFESCSPSENVDGTSPLTIHIEDERTNATGAWTADAWIDEPTPTAIELTIVATVVEQGPVPVAPSAR